jgi:hypothetical protein
MQSYIITMLGHELSEQLSAECRQQAARVGVDVEIFQAIWGRDSEQSHLGVLLAASTSNRESSSGECCHHQAQ